MSIIPHLSQTMQTLLTTTTETIAAALAYVKRPDRAKFTPSTLVQTLVYGWLAYPTATVEQLAQMANRVGVDVSPQAIDRRFTDATTDLLRTVLSASHPEGPRAGRRGGSGRHPAAPAVYQHSGSR